MLLLPPSTLSSDVADDEELQSDVHQMNFGKSIPGNRTQKVTISDDTVKLDSIPLATMPLRNSQSVSQVTVLVVAGSLQCYGSACPPYRDCPWQQQEQPSPQHSGKVGQRQGSGWAGAERSAAGR